MSDLFPNHAFSSNILTHKRLPVIITDEFDFYRCITFKEKYYGKTVSEIHQGNLRNRTVENRHSQLFPYRKVSYWADSPKTASAEVKYHDHSNNLLTFWAYDDATSTFPTLPVYEKLVIVDGLQFEFHKILQKDEEGLTLNDREQRIIDDIIEEEPDCLAYESQRNKGGVNYLFFEKGFRKLAIRELRLRLGDEPGDNRNYIYCAGTCDYAPYLEGYGEYFLPKAKTRLDANYVLSEEYKMRKTIYISSLRNMQ